jgi:hypothetical protein
MHVIGRTDVVSRVKVFDSTQVVNLEYSELGHLWPSVSKDGI